jgi:hypothetical protein
MGRKQELPRQDPKIAALFGTYEIIAYVKPHELGPLEAREKIGSEVIIRADTFQRDETIFNNPRYTLTGYEVGEEEGNVYSRKESMYWGFGTGRKKLTYLNILRPDESGNIYDTYEVIGNGILWNVNGGEGIFILKRRS